MPAKFALPPVWSGCTCVLTINRTGWFETCLIAAAIFALSGANCVSTIKMPSGPVKTPITPPCPSSA